MAINRFAQSSVQSGLPKFDSVWDGRSAVGSIDCIRTISLASAASSVTFNNIPGTYSHLQLRGITFANYRTGIRLNGDTGANYSYHLIGGFGSGSGYSVGSASSNGSTTTIAPTQSGGSNPGSLILDILDYTNTNKNKTIRCFSGFDTNGSGDIWLSSAAWYNPAAITTIMLLPTEGGSNFGQYSTFSLYGIK